MQNAPEINEQKYYVHVVGLDDIHGPYTEIEALREANVLNKIAVEYNSDKAHDERVISWAIVQNKNWIKSHSLENALDDIVEAK